MAGEAHVQLVVPRTQNEASLHAYRPHHETDDLRALPVRVTRPERAETIEKFGYDVKFAYHVVRLLDEVEQIMVEHDLDLERNREQLKAIRRGEWTLDQIERHFEGKERALENTYATSSLRHSPDEPAIKTVLMNCLEMHFGSLADAVRREPSVERLVRDIQDVLARHTAG